MWIPDEKSGVKYETEVNSDLIKKLSYSMYYWLIFLQVS